MNNSKFLKILMTVFSGLFLMGCNDGSVRIPTSEILYEDLDPNNIFVWVGKGEAYIYENKSWKRNNRSDYDFSVVQRRFDNNWLSVKNQVRHHPDYDNKAGPRTQTHIFNIALEKSDNRSFIFELESTFVSGKGTMDEDFIEGVMTFKAENISSFAPFSHFRITQKYDYDSGILTETVFLFKLEDEREIPFAKIEETAKLARLK